jgi:hypothetical protein
MAMNKCVIVVEEDESHKAITCGRDVEIKYESVIELDNGKHVTEIIGVCIRHKDIMDEFLNEQGRYS